MAIFNSYIKLPEGTTRNDLNLHQNIMRMEPTMKIAVTRVET